MMRRLSWGVVLWLLSLLRVMMVQWWVHLIVLLLRLLLRLVMMAQMVHSLPTICVVAGLGRVHVMRRWRMVMSTSTSTSVRMLLHRVLWLVHSAHVPRQERVMLRLLRLIAHHGGRRRVSLRLLSGAIGPTVHVVVLMSRHVLGVVIVALLLGLVLLLSSICIVLSVGVHLLGSHLGLRRVNVHVLHILVFSRLLAALGWVVLRWWGTVV